VALAATGLGLAVAGPASAAGPATAPASTSAGATGLRVQGTWNVRATPGGTLVGRVGPGPVEVDCRAGGPSVTIPGSGTSAVWDHLRGRGYVTDLALTGTPATSIAACAKTTEPTKKPTRSTRTTPPRTAPAPVTTGAIVGLAGKCLTVRGGTKAGDGDSSAVELSDCAGTAAQRWTPSGLTLRALGRCLDTVEVPGKGTAGGTRARIAACDGGAGQTWQLTGRTLRNPATGRCLDVLRADPSDGTATTLRPCNGRPNQIWSTSTAPAPGPAGYGRAIRAEATTWALDSAGGQCKVWAAKVVNAVLHRQGGGRIGGYESRGGAYWGSYAAAGGVRVSAAQAAPGDLIQLNNPADRTSNVHYRAMHSAIIVARASTPGTFVVRDSNWHGDERVTDHLWTPGTTAAKFGLETNYWRFGTD
jgi:Ricin-type beta-trefoil lectin domain